ncbi:MAG: coproporphyrinogen dehydrogenase HemZ [Lawsonibacter sp.]|nr:coproporphyrinogen dehydrogenase HemZ [Lawsonibacter sp.]
MKLYFEQSNMPWQPERFRYAAEQMMLTLFPEERPEYPAGPLPGSLAEEDNAVVFTLHRGKKLTNVSALVFRPQGWHNGVSRFPSEELDRPPEEAFRTVQHALKLAFYKAGTALLGYEPPWGALTGVRPVKLPTRALLAGASPAQARRELERKYHVSSPRAALAADCAQASAAALESLRPDEVSVYVGIPFCPTRCAYCSFVSAGVGRTLNLVEPYLEVLLREADAAGRALARAGLRVRSFYMGGGTPTTLSAGQMDRLLARCRVALPLGGCTEYTVEAGRPDTITAEKLRVLRDYGVGRISINPQTLQDEVLAAIGRRHGTAEFFAAWELARRAGFDCVNTDLIAGLPRDSFDGFRRSLEQVLALEPENVTVHTLALKKGTSLAETRQALPDGAEVARMLDLSREELSGRGWRPYYLYRQKYMSGALENVGWARPGTESLYNIVMMEELHTVVSIGAGGVTKLVDRAQGKIVRLSNPKYPQDYLRTAEKVLAQKEGLFIS